ncbi:MAG: methionyl-tRNA formyltransferase [Candidatus Marinimicrobia bacterium]|nr:methionyl-tRNA formyltransferase [Candidatus Neomarinimicrobiota bacterium]|tara:strand:- start:171 stop:1100 length:930 start_codon:yes stop_codon:yes gene_type:complete
MRIVFMGNHQFAIPTLKKLQESNYEVVGVVSNPPKHMGRGRKLQSTAVGKYAKNNGLNLIEVESLKSTNIYRKLVSLNPDIFVVVAYRILPQPLIKIPKFGAVNLHASLLPKYRGPGPIQWALMNGDELTGVTIFQISKKVDTGAILFQKEFNIELNDNFFTLGQRLCNKGASLMIDTLKGIKDGSIKPISQNHSNASRAPKITKEMTIIDWTWPAKKIHNWIRGLTPFPGMFTKWKGKRLRIFNTKIVNENDIMYTGKIFTISNNEISVSTGKHLLAFSEVQLEGKKRMNVSEFMKGNRFYVGDQLGE